MYVTNVRKDENDVLTKFKLNNGDILSRAKLVEEVNEREKEPSKEKILSGSPVGPTIHVIVINGKNYLRTDKNSIAKDNLDNLPTF